MTNHIKLWNTRVVMREETTENHKTNENVRKQRGKTAWLWLACVKRS